MAVNEGYIKYKKHIKNSDGTYSLCSFWTSSETIEFSDGNTAENKLGALNGITDSLTATSSDIALSSKAGNNLQTQIDEVNNNLSKYQSGTVTCTYVNSTTLYGKITHTLGEQYNCVAVPTYPSSSSLGDILDLSTTTVRGNNYIEFYVKGSGFTNSSGIYVDFLLIGK